MKRMVSYVAVAALSFAGSALAGGGPAKWVPNWAQAKQMALQSGKPVVVYNINCNKDVG